MKAPQLLRSVVGYAYASLPRSVRLGSAYEQWRGLAGLRDPRELERISSEKLRNTLKIASGEVPAFRSLRKLGAALDNPREALGSFPVVDKSAIKLCLSAYTSTKLHSRHRLETFTGGSTTNPMRFYLQRQVSRVREYAFMDDFHARVGMQDGARVLALRGRTVPSARTGGDLWMHEPIKNQLILSSDHLKPEFMPQYVAALRRWRPAFIQAFPSALYPLAKWLALYPAPDITQAIRGVMLYSETTYPHQLQLFRQVFDSGPVLMHYGQSERCVMAATLPGDDRYFFWPQYGYLELIDTQGQAVTKPGEAGEIVCTSFDNDVMPFVRYRTGDRGVLGCSDGSPLPGFPVLDRIEGRLQEMVQCADGRLISITTLGAAHFNELASVTAIQFEQRERGRLLLKVETQAQLTPAVRRSIERAVEEKTQGGCSVQVEEVPTIPRTPAGKQLMLLQRIDLDADFAAPSSTQVMTSHRRHQSALREPTSVAGHRAGRGEIVMIGTALDTQGGIAAVLSVYASVPGFMGNGVLHLPTHCDGNRLKKLRFAAQSWFRYLKLLSMREVRLLHVHSSSGPSFWRKFMFIVPTFMLRRPVALHWHGGRFVSFYNGSAAWQRRMIAWVFRRSDRVIALSEQWHDTLLGLFPVARVITIPNPVVMPTQPASLIAQPPTAVFLGRIAEAKGVFDLLNAWQTVHESLPSARLVLAGVGDMDAARTLAASLGLESCVDFAGWVDGDRKLGLMRSASLFVLPSHAEALPMAVLEAMALGLPIVATRVGGIPHAVRDGEDGFLFDVGDVRALAKALVLLFAEGERRIAMGASARRRVEQNFSVELIVPRIRQVWLEVLAERGDQEPV